MSASRVYRCWVAFGCVALVAAFAFAQPSPKPAPKPAPPKPNPIVTITKLDKTVVRGQLISAEPDQLVVKASGAAGEPVTVRWSQIAKVSNGLTQEQAAEQWKAQHTPEQLCPDCRGNRGIACKDCHGTGHDPAKLVDCKDCGGGGVLFCPNKKCEEGQVDCPMPCLKLTQGRWVDKDGKKVRMFGGGAWVSSGHLGEVWEMKGGQPTSSGRCTTCEGTTKVDCKECAGMAYKICPTCHFEGKTGPACPTCELGRTPCTTCNSTGLRKAA
jgi:hypothetical protein